MRAYGLLLNVYWKFPSKITECFIEQLKWLLTTEFLLVKYLGADVIGIHISGG